MLLISDIDAALDDSNAGDLARHHVAQIRRDYEPEEQPTSSVPNYERFRLDLKQTIYQQRLEDHYAGA